MPYFGRFYRFHFKIDLNRDLLFGCFTNILGVFGKIGIKTDVKRTIYKIKRVK